MTDSLGFQKCRPDIAKHLPLVRRFVTLQLYNTNSMLQILFYQMQPVHVLQTSAKLLSAGECSANDRLPWLSEMSARHCHASAFGDRFVTLQLHNTNSMLLILFYQMQPVHVLQTSAKLLSAGEHSTDDRPSRGLQKCQPDIATHLPFGDSLISTIPSHV